MTFAFNSKHLCALRIHLPKLNAMVVERGRADNRCPWKPVSAVSEGRVLAGVVHPASLVKVAVLRIVKDCKSAVHCGA